MVAANFADSLLLPRSGSEIHETCSSPGAYLKPVIATRDGLQGRRLAAALYPAGSATAGSGMRTYYFDMKDGVPTRDRTGLEFATIDAAIEHCKELARRLRCDPRITDRSLAIVVIDESGAAIHQEPVHPDPAPRPPRYKRSRH